MLTTEDDSVPIEDRQEYQEHVAALFTAPFLESEQLLANLTKYWPGEASETLPGLLAAGFIDRSPTGRYRLPLPPGIPGEAAAEPAVVESPKETTPAPAGAPKERQPAPQTAPSAVTPLPTPLFKPLRLMIPAVARAG